MSQISTSKGWELQAPIQGARDAGGGGLVGLSPPSPARWAPLSVSSLWHSYV